MSVRKTIALLSVLVLAVVAAPGQAAAAEPEPGFCASRTLHDYLAPLSGLPPLRERPYRARSEPFFRGVRIGSSGPSLSIGGGSSAGYQLQWDKNPGWQLTLTFAQVSGGGAIVRALGDRRVGLAALAPVLGTEPRIRLPHRPGFYRATMVIRTHSGRKLATFGNYYRVIEPRIDARLATEAAIYLPGSTVFARVENPGAATVLFGEEFKIEQLVGEAWGPAPAAPGPFPVPLHWVAAGTTSGRCDAFTIPASMSPGRYRVAQETVISWASQKTERRPMLYAEFEVTAP